MRSKRGRTKEVPLYIHIIILFLQMLLLQEVSLSMINNLGTPSFELQINIGVLQIDTENSATRDTTRKRTC